MDIHSGPKGGDERLDFFVIEGFVDAGPFDVQDFSSEGKEGLGHAVAGLFNGSTGGVAFDEEEFAFGSVAADAVAEFSGEAEGFHCGGSFDGFGGFACGFSGLLRELGFFDDALTNGRIFLEVGGESVSDERVRCPLNFRCYEFDFVL